MSLSTTTSKVQCSFCGHQFDRKTVLEGSNKHFVCQTCLLKSRQIISRMQKTLRCDFCGNAMRGYECVEGPDIIHMCADCVEGGIAKLVK